MIKTIFIHEYKDCYKIAREVITRDGLPIEYGPVSSIEKTNFNLKMFSDAIFSLFSSAGEVLKLPAFAENKEAYERYKAYILAEYKERSFNAQYKKSTLFILEWEGEQIRFFPTITTKQGNVGDEEHYKIISIQRKLKVQIAQEIVDLMDEYKRSKAVS